MSVLQYHVVLERVVASLVAGAFLLTMTLAMPAVGWPLDRVPPIQVALLTVAGLAIQEQNGHLSVPVVSSDFVRGWVASI